MCKLAVMSWNSYVSNLVVNTLNKGPVSLGLRLCGGRKSQSERQIALIVEEHMKIFLNLNNDIRITTPYKDIL